MNHLLRAIAATLAAWTVCVAAQDDSAAFKAADAAWRAGDYATVMGLLRPLAERGHPRAQHTLAILYLRGDGVPQDATEGFRWEQKAADAGDSQAQFGVAILHAKGLGTAQDFTESFRRFRQAAENGYPLRLPLEAGWTVGWYGEPMPGAFVIEFIREGDDIRNWRELLTVQSIPSAPGLSPQDVLDRLKRIRESTCPGTTAWQEISRDGRSLLYEWQARPCQGWPDQHEIAKIHLGSPHNLLLRYTQKVHRIPDDVRDRWIRSLAAAR